MLLTRSPLSHLPFLAKREVTAFDLHVLGTPPALILSQDQTLMLKCVLTVPLDQRDLRRAASAMPLAIFNKRLVALLLSVLYRRFTSCRYPSDFLRSTLASCTRRRRLILDGLVVSTRPCGVVDLKCARSI